MDLALQSTSVGLIESSARHDLTLRLVGSIAILVLMKSSGHGRPEFPKDIDLAARGSERNAVQSFLALEGWSVARSLLLVAEMRETYTSFTTSCTLDVFYDEIDGNHAISIADRLSLSWPTLSWTDLFLTKLQRRCMRKEDVWDIALLMSSVESLDRAYFQSVVGDSWPLYTTITDNFLYLERVIPRYVPEIVHLRMLALHASKSFKWRLRSTVGRRVKWWQDVSNAQV